MGDNGTLMLVQVDVGESAEDWHTVAGQRGVSFAETNNLIDFSAKDTGRREVVQVGRLSENISLNGLVLIEDDGYLLLKDASRNGTPVKLRKYHVTQGVLESVLAVITTRNEDWPDQEAATVALEFRTTGDWEQASA